MMKWNIDNDLKVNVYIDDILQKNKDKINWFYKALEKTKKRSEFPILYVFEIHPVNNSNNVLRNIGTLKWKQEK